MRKFNSAVFAAFFMLCSAVTVAQGTFPVNGVADHRERAYAFLHATIVKDAQTTITDGTLMIRKGKIEAIGTGIQVPADAIVVDCKDKFIYPSFIDAYADYGMPVVQRAQGGFNYFAPAQLTNNQKGAYGWNQALRSDVAAAALFTADEAKAKALRDIGFGTVLTHQKDGIARGTGAVVTLAADRDNDVMLKAQASAHYSFSKGTSTQSYPSSIMGSISLLRQTHIDAAWYKNNPSAEGVNLTLHAWNAQQNLPQIFESGDKWNDLRADRIGDEFGVQYILKGGVNEYQRLDEIKATGASYILPLNFPAAMDVDDPAEVRFVGLDDLKNWELAPTNPGAFEKANIPFCLTSADLNSPADFMTQLRKAIESGLTEKKALEALTIAPAKMLQVGDQVGTLEAGKLANFLITSGNIFSEKTIIYQNWIQGLKHGVKEELWNDIKGSYQLTVKLAGGIMEWKMELKEGGAVTAIQKDTVTGKYAVDGKMIKLSFTHGKGDQAMDINMSGVVQGTSLSGTARDNAGNTYTWDARQDRAAAVKTDSVKAATPAALGAVTYPFLAFGWSKAPQQENVIIKNATVWTNEKEGVLSGADVWVKNGKIVQVGKGLQDASATVIDATGKHVTAGIIDEHSHIAAASVNEGGQSVTSEVRIADNLNPDDINIYRQLSGGVTTSHILHGSANTIGGQTQLIKMRWGANDEGLKFKGADPFIKFALGENVKRSGASMGNNRFPDTRMGVEQVLLDAFTRAKDYEAAIRMASVGSSVATKGKKVSPLVGANPFLTVRRDLELDALVEIMNKKRFITCHSYVQSEINGIIKVADKFNFNVNTFTHILEGYKVADKMKAHGAAASTFSDWWNYKMEVLDAIPQNAGIMQKVGLNVAINSDDAEMARRLNQEAAKSIKYTGMSEEDALKMVTLNPAKMLHVDAQVGSLKAGKDADLVIWTDNPLSIYAKAEKTMVDGIFYFDREKDLALRKEVQAEKARLLKKMAAAKKAAPGTGGPAIQRARPRFEVVHTCMDHYHKHGLLEVNSEEDMRSIQQANDLQ